MSDQTPLEFPLPAESARALRDEGAALAEHALDTRWRLAAEAALQRLAAAGGGFTADDLRRQVGAPPGHASGVGSLFLAAAKRGEIVHVGYRPSVRPEARTRPLKVWRGTGVHHGDPDTDADCQARVQRIRAQTAAMREQLHRQLGGDAA